MNSSVRVLLCDLLEGRPGVSFPFAMGATGFTHPVLGEHRHLSYKDIPVYPCRTYGR